jgi:N-acetylmuramoyl-L-alanine amidase
MKTISIHASMTPSSEDIGRLELEKQHRQLGYFQIGYHYVIRRNGTTETGRSEVSPCPLSSGIAVCLIGGVDSRGAAINNFTSEQIDSLSLLWDTIHRRESGNTMLVSKTPSVSQTLIDSLKLK